MDNRTAYPQQVANGSGQLSCVPALTYEPIQYPATKGYQHQPVQYRSAEIRLREALARTEARIRQQDELIQRQELLKKESDHRLLNDLQMTISLLSLQSRGSTNAEAAAQLAIAANRVAMIARIHRRLNSYEGLQTLEFKKFLADLGRDFSAMVSSEGCPQQISIEGSEVNLPVATAIPLGFIASELLTNAAKYGEGPITIGLTPSLDYGYALSVSNRGLALPEGFDPNAGNGLGMKIIRSFVSQIRGELRFGRADDGQGARFTIVFPKMADVQAMPAPRAPSAPL